LLLKLFWIVLILKIELVRYLIVFYVPWLEGSASIYFFAQKVFFNCADEIDPFYLRHG
jgi:hypothetical protein